MRSVPFQKLSSLLRVSVLVIFTSSLSFLSYSQNDNEPVNKLSPLLRQQLRVTNTQERNRFVIALSPNNTMKELLTRSPSIFTIYEYSISNVFVIACTWQELWDQIIPRPDVVFIDMLRTAKEEVAVSNFDIGTNKINLLHRLFPLYNGNSLGVSVKEHRPDTNDIDYKGRYMATPLTSSTLSSHATIMSTIIAGAGNTYYEGRGVANGATLNSVNFSILLPEPDAFYQQFNTSVQNHSYGTGIENFYGADASAYDASVVLRAPLLHVFSAGNSGLQTSTAGTYAGVNAFANITGSFKMAKNILTVGHTDSFGVVLPLSSRGPAYDGRVKPDLVAFGEDGSSGAAAIVSGMALTLQQAYKDLNGALPSSALIRAVLLNSADDAGAKGIDFVSGYGAVNGMKAMQAIIAARYITGSIGTGGLNSHALVVPPNLKQLKITIAWTDPPAIANASKALINDIDIELDLPSLSQTWQPWVLSHFPHVDSLVKLPVRKRDSLNTAEQITIDLPVPGNYIINVKGFNISAASPQTYFITYQFDTLDKFQWHYPTSQDNIFSGNVNAIRWESSYPAAVGQLEYSINNGSSWQTINSAVDLARGYFKWNAPDTFVNALLRMNFASQSFSSESFTISKRFNVSVGFNCPDSFLFYWNRQKGVNAYRVYKLGAKYMELLINTPDTSIVLGKLSNPSLHYAVAPILNGQTGVRSFGFNYTTQGVGCYIRSFFATLAGNTGVLDLELGTNYQVKSIAWEKLVNGQYVQLQLNNIIAGLLYSYVDPSLKTGLNIYRVKITLTDNRVIYSQTETIYYFGENKYIVYPNPAGQYNPITILSRDAMITNIQIFNSAGVKVFEKQLTDLSSTLPLGLLSKGFYLFLLTDEEGKKEVLRLIIQ